MYQAVTNALTKPYGTSILMIPKDIQQAFISPDHLYNFKKLEILQLKGAAIEIESIKWLTDWEKPKLIVIGST